MNEVTRDKILDINDMIKTAMQSYNLTTLL